MNGKEHTGKWVAYYRVSTKRQGESGLGLEAQEKAVGDYLDGGDWKLVGAFTEVESGKRADRPELAKAISLCKSEGATLIIAKLDRLARDVEFIAGLMKRVSFRCVQFPDADELMLHIHAAMAQHEAKMISQRTRAGLERAKARGVKLGRPELGEANRAAADEFARKMAPIIERLSAEGFTSTRALAAEMNRRRIRTARGGKWHSFTVSCVRRRILGLSSKNVWLHGDLRDLIPGINDKSVQLLLTDPPYGMNFQSDYRLNRSAKHRHAKIIGDKNPEEALGLLAEMLELMLPKMKEPGSALIFSHPRTSYLLWKMIEVRFPKRLTYQTTLVWGKRSKSGVLQGGMGDVKTTCRPCHEVILYYSVGVRAPILKGEKRPGDLLFAPKPRGKHHPTEKPVDLLRELIADLTVEGDLVADPFGGVGSTALAAKLSGRRYWSCEIDETYYRHGCERLEDAALPGELWKNP